LISTKLTDGTECRFDLKPAKPIRRPSFAGLRVMPVLSPSAAETMPERKACMDTSRHHGASVSFTSFHRFDNDRQTTTTPESTVLRHPGCPLRPPDREVASPRRLRTVVFDWAASQGTQLRP